MEKNGINYHSLQQNKHAKFVANFKKVQRMVYVGIYVTLGFVCLRVLIMVGDGCHD